MLEGTSQGAITLGVVDLVLASALVVVAGVVSVLFRLGLERRLVVAALRTVVQLTLLGYVLEWIFAIDHAAPLCAALGVMLTLAGRAAVQRSDRTFEGVTVRAIGTLTLTGLLTCFAVTELIIGVDPWYEAQYVLPILGMILGNSLTGISLCLDSLLGELDEQRALVEADLALGATRWEAAREPIAGAVRRGMIPIINSMTVVGLVSLPGMMTGQILAGADPMQAIAYQIVVMFMLAASTALGAIGVALLVYRALFNDRHQLVSGRITRT